MPYKCEKKIIPAGKDRRRKLTDAEKADIRRNSRGLSQRALAAEYDVSRRTIQFIQNPEALAENLKRREERGGSKQYYNTEDQAIYMRGHRRYKKMLDDQGVLLPAREKGE